ncbi:hypothetical protein V1224_03135 [Lachnospiraceae bacterium JLR.KK008]
MDFQNNSPNQMPYNMPGGPGMQNQMPYPMPPVRQQENIMANAAMITGLVGAASIIFLPFYLPCIFGGISIVLALLSKGSQSRLSPHAKIGFIVTLCSFTLNAILFVFAMYLLMAVPEYQQQFNQLYEQMYGESFDDMMEDTFWD